MIKNEILLSAKPTARMTIEKAVVFRSYNLKNKYFVGEGLAPSRKIV